MILAYCAGAALGARPAGTPAPGDPVWPRRVTAGLAAEFVFMAAHAVGWRTSGSRPGKWVALALALAPPAAPLLQLAVLGTVVAVGGAVAAKR